MELFKAVVLFLVSFIVLETSILINLYSTAVFPHSGVNTSLSSGTQRLFAAYDTNVDGVIDVWEFEAVKQRLNEPLSAVCSP